MVSDPGGSPVAVAEVTVCARRLYCAPTDVLEESDDAMALVAVAPASAEYCAMALSFCVRCPVRPVPGGPSPFRCRLSPMLFEKSDPIVARVESQLKGLKFPLRLLMRSEERRVGK